jgi:hypothetical protein
VRVAGLDARPEARTATRPISTILQSAKAAFVSSLQRIIRHCPADDFQGGCGSLDGLRDVWKQAAGTT